MYQKIKNVVQKLDKTMMIAIIAMFTTGIASAQVKTKIAVLDFKAGAGVAQSEVDGISAILITYLNDNSKFTIVERTQISRVISEQGFQISYLTQREMVRIGEILNVRKIVVGDVNIVGGQYNIDCRIIDVQTGETTATAGETWARNAPYRNVMQRLAQTLGSKMAVIDAAEQRRKAEERAVEERAAEQRKIAEAKRIAEEKKNSMSVIINGVKWATFNVGSSGTFVSKSEDYGNYYTWEQSRKACPAGWRMPNQSEFQSLVNAGSIWTTRNGVAGRQFGSGVNTIFLPASGCRDSNGAFSTVGTNANYWSSTQYDSTSAYNLGIGSDYAQINNFFNYKSFGFCVRCVAE